MRTINTTDRNWYLNIKRWFHFKKRDFRYWLRIKFTKNMERTNKKTNQ